MSVYQALITIDPATFVVQICNLFLQIFILKTLLLNPVRKVLADRQAKADADIAAAKQASADAAAIKAEYEQNMAEAMRYMDLICNYDPLYITSSVNSGELIISYLLFAQNRLADIRDSLRI